MLNFNWFVLCFTGKEIKKYSSRQGYSYSNSPTRVPFSHRGALSDSSRSILSGLCTGNLMLMCGHICHLCSFESVLEVFRLNAFLFSFIILNLCISLTIEFLYELMITVNTHTNGMSSQTWIAKFACPLIWTLKILVFYLSSNYLKFMIVTFLWTYFLFQLKEPVILSVDSLFQESTSLGVLY